MTWSRSEPLTSTTARPRAGRIGAAPLQLAATGDAPCSVTGGELVERLRAEAVGQHRHDGLEALRAVGGAGDRPEDEPPLGVLDREQALLRLGVRQRQRDRRAVRRRAQDQQVANDHPRDDPGEGAARGADAVPDVYDYVDVIAGLDEAAEQLVRVAGNRHRALIAGDAREHTLLGYGPELLHGDLLAGDDDARDGLVGDLVGAGDRARHDVPPEHRGALEVPTAGEGGSRRSLGNVAGRDEHLGEGRSVLDVLA